MVSASGTEYVHRRKRNDWRRPSGGVADIATLAVGGAVTASIDASLKDTAPPNYAPPGQTVATYDKANDNDDKTRFSELEGWFSEFNSPLCAFNLDGSIGVQLFSQEQLFGSSTLTFTQVLASATIFDWSTAQNCFDAQEPLGYESPSGVVTLYTGPLYADRDVWVDGSDDVYTFAGPLTASPSPPAGILWSRVPRRKATTISR